jgi:hypothetical protein
VRSFDLANVLLTIGLIAGIVGLVVLGKLLMYFEKRGWIRVRGGYRPSSGVGNCFLAAEILGKPQMQYVMDAKKNVRRPNRRKSRGGASPPAGLNAPELSLCAGQVCDGGQQAVEVGHFEHVAQGGADADEQDGTLVPAGHGIDDGQLTEAGAVGTGETGDVKDQAGDLVGIENLPGGAAECRQVGSER